MGLTKYYIKLYKTSHKNPINDLVADTTSQKKERDRQIIVVST
jgi:hypothetical protein